VNLRTLGRDVRTDPRTGLAVLRVVVVAVVLLNPATQEAVRWASLPPPLVVPLEGLWSLPIPVTPLLGRVGQVLLVASCFAALLGVYTRVALVTAAVTAAYVLGLPQRQGNVIHHHHLVWLLAILAVSPCADALAWDRGPPRPDRAYALPLSAARLVFGLVYLFPGVHKLAEQGLGWALSDNLRLQMWWKWTQFEWVPALRVDHHPLVLQALGLGTLAFELGFVVLVLFPRTRLFALATGLAFHLGTAWLMKIEFPTLFLCYVGLLAGGAPRRSREGVSSVTLAVIGVVLAAITVQGIRGQMRAWPFACYPTFQWRPGAEMPDLQVTGYFADGRAVVLFGRPHAQAEWGAAWTLVGLQGPLDRARLAAFVAGRPAPPGVVRRVAERVWWSVDPDLRGAPPLRREVLLSVP